MCSTSCLANLGHLQVLWRKRIAILITVITFSCCLTGLSWQITLPWTRFPKLIIGVSFWQAICFTSPLTSSFTVLMVQPYISVTLIVIIICLLTVCLVEYGFYNIDTICLATCHPRVYVDVGNLWSRASYSLLLLMFTNSYVKIFSCHT